MRCSGRDSHWIRRTKIFSTLNPTSWRSWGDFNGALAANDAYMAIRPGDPNPLDSRGDILFMAGRDDEAVASYRKVLELKPDFSDYAEYLKLAIVYTDQKKPDMANAAFQQFAQPPSPLSRLYVPGFEAQFKQTEGDFEGALTSYREAVLQLGQRKTELRRRDFPAAIRRAVRPVRGGFLRSLLCPATEARRRGTANGRLPANYGGKPIRRAAELAAIRLQPSLGRASGS